MRKEADMAEIDIVLLNSIRADLQQTKLVSQNIANAGTPGFKQIMSNRISNAQDSDKLANSSLINTQVNLEQGQLQVTNNPFDLSVNGSGFMLANLNGIEHLISSQRFSLNKDNELVTADGSLLQGTSGAISLSDGNFVVNAEGEILVDQQVVDKISVVSVSDRSDIVISPNGLLLSNQTFDTSSEESFSVSQGQLQMSNVDSSHQMIRLMELTKHIESTQKAFSTLDQLMDSGINQIGNR